MYDDIYFGMTTIQPGDVFSHLTAIKCTGKNKHGNITWQFQCQCGSIIDVPSYPVRSGRHKSCGCLSSRKRVNGKFVPQPIVGTTQVCLHCKQEKELNLFRLNRRSPVHNKRHARCKQCENLLHKKPDKKARREYCHDYYLNNRTYILRKTSKYRSQNKEKFKITRRIRDRKLYSEPVFRLRKLISVSIRGRMKKHYESSWKYLPYTKEELKIHLENLFEPWMNWSNQGSYYPDLWDDNNPDTWKWQIDHIIPHSNFIYSSMTDESFQLCWALSNLRPLSAKQNYLDGMCSRVRHSLSSKKGL